MVTELIKSEMSSLTKNLLKEDYLKFKEEKKQLKIASLKENVVFTESLTPFSEEFASTLKSLTLFEDRIQKMKMVYPELHKESDKLWTSLNEVNSKRDVKLIRENIANIINLYCHVQEELTMTEEHPFKGTWANLQIREEISKADVPNNSKLLFGIPKIKRAMVSLNEGKMLLSERLETKDLMKVQNAIERLKELLSKYPLQAISKKINDFDNKFKQLINDEHLLQDRRAVSLITQAQALYGALTKFFSQDMVMIMKMDEFKSAKDNPDSPIKDIEGIDVDAIIKMITSRLTPSLLGKIVNYFDNSLSKLKSYFGDFQEQDKNKTIDKILNKDEIMSLANEIVFMNFNQLSELVNASKGLPKPQSIATITNNQQNQSNVDTDGPTTPDKLEALKTKFGNDTASILANFNDKDGNPLDGTAINSIMSAVKSGKNIIDILSTFAKGNQ
jgi:hypothetical protein